MEQKIGLDKAAYAMLTVSGLLALLCIVGGLGASVYGFIEALGDSNGGGWLMLIILMVGIFFFPTIVSWVVQVVMYTIGMRRYKKGNLPSARTFGIINSIAAILGNGCLIAQIVTVLMSDEEQLMDLYIFVMVLVLCIIYMLFPLILLILSKKRDKSVQNQVSYEEENNPENGY